jgi:hypothetical protein
MRLALTLALMASLAVAPGCTESTPPDDEQMQQEEPPDDEENGMGGAEHFNAQLSGSETFPDPVDTDATGIAEFELSADGTTLSFTLTVSNIEDAFAAHIHLGASGTAGEIAVFLYDGDAVSLTGVLSQGTATDADVVSSAVTDLDGLAALMRSGDAYVNVHTVPYPAGEIRGQISKQ